MRKYIISFLFLVAVLPLMAALTDVTVEKDGADVVVSLIFDSEYSYNVVNSIEGVTGVVIDFDGMISLLPMDLFKVYKGGVTEVEAVRFDDADFLRVIVNTTEQYPYEVEAEEGVLRIIFKNVNSEVFDTFIASTAYNVIEGNNEETVTEETFTEETTEPTETEMTETVEETPEMVVEENTVEENTPSEVPVVEEEETVVMQEEAPVVEPKPVIKKQPVKKNGLDSKIYKKITLELENADLLTVLRGLAETAGINIIASKNVKGSVTVHLKDVPWIDALEVILKSVGYTYRIDPTGIVRIATGDEFKKEDEIEEMAQEKVTRIYKLEFAKAKDASRVLKKELTKTGYIETDERTNSVVVSDIPKVQEKLKGMIAEIDVPTKQVEIVAKVVEVNDDITTTLGINWQVYNVGVTNTVSVTQAGVVEPAGGPASVTIGTIPSYANLSATLDALESKGKTKIISNPRVTVTNNTKASIINGTKFSVRTVDANGNAAVQMFTAGTSLEVTPHINSMDEITLEIRAEMSTVEDPTSATPIIHTVEAETEQLLKDGETIVMGGFTSSELQKNNEGVPFISRIPIIGALFGTQSHISKQKEVLIFITPHIIKDM